MENLTMPAQRQCPSWRFGMALAFGIVGASISIGTPSLAQVTPDTTLGAEGSVVVLPLVLSEQLVRVTEETFAFPVGRYQLVMALS